jgi:hypothetical protein
MQLAYLLAEAVDGDNWAGGLLVTDERGLPVDFRYVEPIRPSKLQKLIYGDSLTRYLKLEAIAGTLIKASKIQADWVFTCDQVLLELNGQVPGRLISIENGEKGRIGGRGEWRVDQPGRITFQVTESGHPVILTFRVKDTAGMEEIARDLSWLAERLDFTEPLDRVHAALKEICSGGMD